MQHLDGDPILVSVRRRIHRRHAANAEHARQAPLAIEQRAHARLNTLNQVRGNGHPDRFQGTGQSARRRER
jgi:hypothetical protein